MAEPSTVTATSRRDPQARRTQATARLRHGRGDRVRRERSSPGPTRVRGSTDSPAAVAEARHPPGGPDARCASHLTALAAGRHRDSADNHRRRALNVGSASASAPGSDRPIRASLTPAPDEEQAPCWRVVGGRAAPASVRRSSDRALTTGIHAQRASATERSGACALLPVARRSSDVARGNDRGG